MCNSSSSSSRERERVSKEDIDRETNTRDSVCITQRVSIGMIHSGRVSMGVQDMEARN